MHAVSSYRGNRPTNKHTRKQTGPNTIHCAAKLSAQCNYPSVWTETITDGTGGVGLPCAVSNIDACGSSAGGPIGMNMIAMIGR